MPDDHPMLRASREAFGCDEPRDHRSGLVAAFALACLALVMAATVLMLTMMR